MIVQGLALGSKARSHHLSVDNQVCDAFQRQLLSSCLCVCSGTIEEKVYQRQIFKHMLTKRILVDPRQSQSFSTRDLQDLFTLSEGVSHPST